MLEKMFNFWPVNKTLRCKKILKSISKTIDRLNIIWSGKTISGNAAKKRKCVYKFLMHPKI